MTESPEKEKKKAARFHRVSENDEQDNGGGSEERAKEPKVRKRKQQGRKKEEKDLTDYAFTSVWKEPRREDNRKPREKKRRNTRERTLRTSLTTAGGRSGIFRLSLADEYTHRVSPFPQQKMDQTENCALLFLLQCPVCTRRAPNPSFLEAMVRLEETWKFIRTPRLF